MVVRYHVVRRGQGWSVERTGAYRASAHCSTKAEAVRRARRLAKRNAAQVLVHDDEGGIAQDIPMQLN